LKFELAFVEDGGYGRSVRTPRKPTSPFQDSLTRLNFGDSSRRHPCAECISRVSTAFSTGLRIFGVCALPATRGYSHTDSCRISRGLPPLFCESQASLSA